MSDNDNENRKRNQIQIENQINKKHKIQEIENDDVTNNEININEVEIDSESDSSDEDEQMFVKKQSNNSMCRDASLYLSAVLGNLILKWFFLTFDCNLLEYISLQIIELATNETRKTNQKRIDPSHLQQGIVNNKELDK